MRIDLADLISVTDANNKGVSKLVNEASEGRQFVVLRNNKPTAAIVGVDKLERLGQLEELQDDMKLLAITLARTVTDSGERISLEDAAASLGIGLDELDELDEGSED
jgi:prevent-host-death family protein